MRCAGGHLNPAITAAMCAAGVTTPVQAIAHIVAQFVGGIIATFLLIVLVPQSVLKGTHLGANFVPDDGHLLRAFLGAPPHPAAACGRCRPQDA